MTTEDESRPAADRETRAALLAGVLAAVLVIFLTIMALIALNPAGTDLSAIAAALA